MTGPELAFHIEDVYCEPVFAREFSAIHIMIDFLVVLKLLVYLGLLLKTHASPKKVPFILISLLNVLGRQNLFEYFCVRVN